MEFQKEELNEILNIFQQESQEIIASMDSKLLMLEKENNEEIAIQLFRDAHSLKGSARMLGFNHIQDIAHKIEDVISLIKEDKLKITTELTDTISECLELVLVSINKTVETKEEYISPQTDQFLEKLKFTTQNCVALKEQTSSKTELTKEDEELKRKFEGIEDILLDILYTLSKARQTKDFREILDIEKSLNLFLDLIQNLYFDFTNVLKQKISEIQKALEKFKTSKNQELDFLEINVLANSLIEEITKYADKKDFKRKNYYEIVNNALDKENHKEENKKQAREVEIVENDKIEDIEQKLPLLEMNTEFFSEIFDYLNDLIYKSTKANSKQALIKIKEILTIYKSKNKTLAHDILLGILKTLNHIKNNEEDELKDSIKKLKILQTMINFEQKEHKPLIQEDAIKHSQISQKEILNSITNTEIKTLRVDSIKLDNLVGQIGELIVSKIKTNEQLSLAKKISSDLIEWQKNFNKMNYYIKYFDKKYLSNSISGGETDNSKIVAYNKQLLSLGEMHGEKILSLIKEMGVLFKQLQESEAKLNTTTTEIETMVKNMRVLPLSTIFQLFPRMVHNIARDKNKKIDLMINGEDVCADKTIVEELKIPIMHIIRNSIDHGIEDIQTRKQMGKNPIGKIEISAYYKDSMVVVDVKDDGRGLDIEKIKKKALEKILLTKEEIEAINDEELTNLIFYPGFSTEDFVTELSGRGLGLDIVNNKINQLQGRIDVYSQLNQGTIVRIAIPSAIATRKVFIVQEQNQLFAIETSVIKTILRINFDEIFEKDKNNYFIYQDCAIPIYTLSQILNYKKPIEETNKYTLAIIETDNIIFGIIIQKLISDQDVVHKKLSPPLYKVKHISGITTLANGEACLILNISDIINTITSKKLKTKLLAKNEFLEAKNNHKYKILIVDDSRTTRILQKNILSNHGYSVSSAIDPISALEKLKKDTYDLVVSDVQMPNMNGFEFVMELRKIPKYEHLPVIMVSSENPENHKDDIIKSQIVKYIQKNLFKQDELIKTIEEILNY